MAKLPWSSATPELKLPSVRAAIILPGVVEPEITNGVFWTSELGCGLLIKRECVVIGSTEVVGA